MEINLCLSHNIIFWRERRVASSTAVEIALAKKWTTAHAQVAHFARSLRLSLHRPLVSVSLSVVSNNRKLEVLALETVDQQDDPADKSDEADQVTK